MTASRFISVAGHGLAKRIFERYLQKKIPHSFVLVGPRGVGKRLIAEELIGRLFCQTHIGCGICSGCHEWVKDVNRGRYVFKRGQLITIDQIRKVREDLTKSDWRGNSRVVLVEDAAAITVPAANAILQILEEPGIKIYYIFVAENLRKVLGTIVSRSVIIPFNRLSNQEMDEVLAKRGIDQGGFKKILMGRPAQIDKVSSVSMDIHQKNVKNFWLLTQTNSSQKMDFATKAANLDKSRLAGLFYFWESCLRDYLLWRMGQNEFRWWQSDEMDEFYKKMKLVSVSDRITSLAVINERIDIISKKIQLFNWLLSFKS